MTWTSFIAQEKTKPYFKKLMKTLKKESKSNKIYPNFNQVFSAFDHSPFDQVKVVILGMDPYHGHNQAHGLSFSVQPGVDIPPSLRNIYKELQNDLQITPPAHGNLVNWAKQGVFLLNAALTVQEGKPGSHQTIWKPFTDATISLLNQRETPLVFILWGNFAKQKAELITNSRHLVLTASHPSPLSAHNGFFGSKPFSQTNDFLIKNNLNPINWDLAKI